MFVLALGLFVWGALVASPWFTGPADAVAFKSPVYETVMGVIFMGIGGLRMVGVVTKSKRWMLAAPYGLMMGYLFLSLLRICAMGWFPLTWVPTFLCALIAGICRLAILYGGKVE